MTTQLFHVANLSPKHFHDARSTLSPSYRATQSAKRSALPQAPKLTFRNPSRPTFPWEAVLGTSKITVNTDAHATDELDQIRRAWLTPSDLINTQTTAEALLGQLRPKL